MMCVLSVGDPMSSSNTTILLVVGTLLAVKAVDIIVALVAVAGIQTSVVPVNKIYPSSPASDGELAACGPPPSFVSAT